MARPSVIVSIIVFGLGLATTLVAATDVEERLQRMEQLLKQQATEMDAMRRRIVELETQVAPSQSSTPTTMVDLQSARVSLLPSTERDHILTRPWFENIDISGFGAFGYLDTGRAGSRPVGGFQIKEASLFVEADIWADHSLFLELQTNRLGDDRSRFVRTGEIYGHFRDLLPNSWLGPVGVKLGRLDIPFGEEYLWQDAIDNPLISNSAAYVYGFDEGVLFYGNVGGTDWIASVMDGTDERSSDDHSTKAYNLKLSKQFTDQFYASASYMHNGKSAESAIEFGGSHLQPVGTEFVSTLGKSPSEIVEAELFEVDAKLSLPAASYVALSFGQAFQRDANPDFDRDLTWYSIEPYWQINENWYLVGRLSEVGTYDSNRGYQFAGKTISYGHLDFGYDVERLRRVSLGVGWEPNPRMKLKVELGQDSYRLIDASNLDADDTTFLGIEWALKL